MSGTEVSATSSDNKKALKLTDAKSGRKILIDTGAPFSFWPADPMEREGPSRKDLFTSVSGAPLRVFKVETREIDLGLGKMQQAFFVADVAQPLVGFDFLEEHGLLVDCRHRSLVASDRSVGVVGKLCAVEAVSVSITSRAFASLLKEFPSLTEEAQPTQPKHDVQHKISLLPDAKPFKVPARRAFGAKLDSMNESLTKMRSSGVIRPSSSQWASALHMVRKKDGTWRPCGDFRQLNKITKRDNYPLPFLEDFQPKLLGKKVFSKVDLVKAFHQIPMEEQSIPLTAIITPVGLFEFLKMPFGLKNAAQAFQRFVDEVLRGLQDIHVYMDDILIASDDLQSNVKAVKALFERLDAHGLRINVQKSVFGVEAVDFLGFRVSSSGVAPLEDRLEAFRSFPKPSNKKSLQQFLGMANFYSRFTPNFAHAAAPLYELLKTKTKEISWSEKAQAAFDAVKAELSRFVELTFPSARRDTRLCTDASDVAVGAVLEQWDTRRKAWLPVAIHSRKLSPAEKNYSVFDRELLAIRVAVKKFHYIVTGLHAHSQFYIATDHKPLTSLGATRASASAPISARNIRAWEEITSVTTDIRYVEGALNIVADALSRAEVAAVTRSEGRLQQNLQAGSSLQPECPAPASLVERIAAEQRRLGMFREKDLPDHWRRVQLQNVELVADTRGGRLRPVVPDALRREVFDAMHGLSHPGVVASKKLISQHFVWTALSRDVTDWARSCLACQASKTARHTLTPFKELHTAAAGKFESVHLDIVIMPDVEGHKYLLTMIDRFSRWVEATPLKAIDAAGVARAFLETWIQRYGVPLHLTTDRGAQFTSDLWAEMMRLLGTSHSLTTSYHPQSNGLIERFHRTLKAALMASHSGLSWMDKLPLVLLSLRAMSRAAEGVSIGEAAFGVNLTLPAAAWSSQVPQEIGHHLRQLREASDLFKTDYHGRSVTPYIPPSLKSCPYVFERVDAVKKPLERPYRGPFQVLSRDDKTVTIKKAGKEVVVSLDRVKPARL